jgi:hypothetical protein
VAQFQSTSRMLDLRWQYLQTVLDDRGWCLYPTRRETSTWPMSFLSYHLGVSRPFHQGKWSLSISSCGIFEFGLLPPDDTGQQSIAPGEVFSSRLEKIRIIGLKQTTLFLEMGNDSLKFMKGGTFPRYAFPWREGALVACAKPKPGA